MDKTTQQVIAIIEAQMDTNWYIRDTLDKGDAYRDRLLEQIWTLKHIVYLFEDDEYRSKMYEIYKDRIEKEDNTCDM